MNRLRLLLHLIFIAVGLVLVSYFVVQIQPRRSRAAAITTIPQEARVFYGMTDANRYEQYEAMGVFDVATIVGGYTTDAAFVHRLREKNILFAYIVQHINYHDAVKYPMCQSESTLTECADMYARHLTKPYLETLGGQLPGGFDAIIFNEVQGFDDNTFDGKLERAMLKRIKELFPNKLLIVWATGCVTTTCMSTNSIDNKLMQQTLRDYTDLALIETYEAEGSDPKLFTNRENTIRDLEQHAPGIMKKAIIGVGQYQIEQFRLDRDPEVDYFNFIDELIYRRIHFSLPGVEMKKGIYFYPWQFQSGFAVKRWAVKLIKHYYIDGQTTHLGDGVYKKGTASTELQTGYITNASFENQSAMASWNVDPSASVAWSEYGVCYPLASRCPNQPDIKISSLPRVPHLLRALKMTRGSTPSVARQTVAVKPNTTYELVAYVKSQTSPYVPKGRVTVLDASGRTLAQAEAVESFCNLYIATGDWGTCKAQYNTFSLIKVTFQSGAETAVTVRLSDDPATSGAITLWDYIEMDDAHGISSDPPPTPTITRLPTMTPAPTATPVVPSITQSPTATPAPSPTVVPSPTPLVTGAPTPTLVPSLTPQPSLSPSACTRKVHGDADCDGLIKLVDFTIWLREYTGIDNSARADFNGNGTVSLIDYEIFRLHYE